MAIFKIVSSSFYRSQPVFSQRSWSHLAKNLCGNLTPEKIYRLGCHENRDEDNSNNDKNHQTATSKSSSPGISGILGTCRNPTPDTSTLHFSFSPLSVSTVQRFELGSHFVLTTWRVCFNCHNSLRKLISNIGPPLSPSLQTWCEISTQTWPPPPLIRLWDILRRTSDFQLSYNFAIALVALLSMAYIIHLCARRFQMLSVFCDWYSSSLEKRAKECGLVKLSSEFSAGVF